MTGQQWLAMSALWGFAGALLALLWVSKYVERLREKMSNDVDRK